MTPDSSCNPWIPSPREALLALSLAIGLTFCFWWPFWLGGGPIGGDLYSYYMPQKAVLAEALEQGEYPLWNNRAGFGYPLVAESQTGALYPPSLILYRVFDLNTAYVVSQLLHYVIAFLAAWGVARQLGISTAGAALAALSFVYGWLPARICLEWAAIGAAYYAVIIWCALGWLQTGCPRSLGALAIAIGLDLLAGHFHLAFIALLTVALLTVLRGEYLTSHLPAATLLSGRRGWVVLAMGAGLLIAAVQLLPTWELKQLSQRDSVGANFNPGYGHIPPPYLTELVAPWLWHGADMDADIALGQLQLGRYPAATNKVEAHLYGGLLPLLLAVASLVSAFQSGQLSRGMLAWTILGLCGLLLATGWPLIVLQHVPGFNFFTGPGRYGIMTAMALGILAGYGWDRLVPTLLGKQLLMPGLLLAFLFTLGDLWAVSREYVLTSGPYVGRQVFYATLLDEVPARHLGSSPVARRFQPDSATIRLYAPGANIPSLMGLSALPVYLGLGPTIYYSEDLQIDFDTDSPTDIETASRHLREWGVTHLFLQSRIDTSRWPVDFVAEVTDPVVNAAMARREPFFLYALRDPLGRIRLSQPGTLEQIRFTANSVRMVVDSPTPNQVTLADLNYPGWTVRVDGQPREMLAAPHFRAVDLPAGRHEVHWQFQPWTIRLGTCVSIGSLLLVVAGAWIAFRRRRCQLSVPPEP